ncbi:NIPSNAP family protein [Salinarimonas soli]|uniref:NIPSNAP family protein n=1 Tax=Salinarimonas soli TaxID=1638099 RepID=A0A5B2V721_9HYPH|nr:NIPSNAP family protein [Salinarimonas soli]KAA2234751.1 NIPSNAP family protein [Salinarimonas soli]
MHDASKAPEPRSRAGQAQARSPVLELRQYTLHPGQRDTLIDLFDREFVETQEVVGMRVMGQFRDLDDPHRFVWLRGFPDMPARARALAAFYGGPVWAAHRDAANATMIDSDDVLLLRPAMDGQGLPEFAGERPPPGTGGDGHGLVVASILHLDPQRPAGAFAELFESEIRPRIAATGGDIVGSFITEESPNTFPRLPVREGERVWVTLARHRNAATLEAGSAWRDRVGPDIRTPLVREPEVLRLKPTARSLLHG